MTTYLIDNKTKQTENLTTVYDFIKDFTSSGKLSIVTGYVTVGALSQLFTDIEENKKISEYNIIIGELVKKSQTKREKGLNLLTSIDSVLNIKQDAKNAIDFLSLEKVLVRTVEPSFCHAKVYIFQNDSTSNSAENFVIIGSSNLTEAGVGYSKSDQALNFRNFELNILYQDKVLNPTLTLMEKSTEWYKKLWENHASENKLIYNYNKGIKIKESDQNFKQFLINEIQKNYADPKTPNDIYIKILYELNKDVINKEIRDLSFIKQITKLENTSIYQALFEFQKKGVISLIKMLQTYNCAILGDAVGLGKTWSALAVIKFFQMENYKIILLTPKRLRNNWSQYRKDKKSRFESDSFQFIIRNHTDLQEGTIDNRNDDYTIDDFTGDSKTLLVIDESHNLRNSESKRYKFLLDNIIKKNKDIKVLMLSATPINTSLSDINNQFKLGTKDNNKAFETEMEIKNLSSVYNEVKKKYKDWTKLEKPTVQILREMLPKEFLLLTESLIVARTRNMIENHIKKDEVKSLRFPEKTPPKHLYITPENIGGFSSIDDILNSFPKNLSAYKPATYLGDLSSNKKVSASDNEVQRDKYLVKMMHILLAKRLESSWQSFSITVNNMLNYHYEVLEKITEYKNKSSESINITFSTDYDENQFEEEEDFSIGNRKGDKEIKLSQIEKACNLEKFENDIKTDISSLEFLKTNLELFKTKINDELNIKNNHNSIDNKLEELIKLLKDKKTKDNKKVIIFTVFKDTADYLFEQLKERGFENFAKVSGTDSKTYKDPYQNNNNFEPILQRFAPYTKLYMEKEYLEFKKDNKKSEQENYKKWIEFINSTDTYSKTKDILNDPIDILIATDCLSEGQNLQDSDMVVNYDIHWNPVRIIQRMGRVDRLGSPNEKIQGVNFWPAKSIEDYISLKKKVENRMVSMVFAGSEADSKMVDSEHEQDLELENQQVAKMLKQMKSSLSDIQKDDDSLGLQSLSAENYKNDLYYEVEKRFDEIDNMPDGIYSGVDTEKPEEKGLIALLRRTYKRKKQKLEELHLVYLNNNSQYILKDKIEIINFLSKNRDKDISNHIKHLEKNSINSYSTTLRNWVKEQIKTEKVLDDGNIKEFAGQAELAQISFSYNELDKVESINVEEDFDYQNFELICWMSVS